MGVYGGDIKRKREGGERVALVGGRMSAAVAVLSA